MLIIYSRKKTDKLLITKNINEAFRFEHYDDRPQHLKFIKTTFGISDNTIFFFSRGNDGGGSQTPHNLGVEIYNTLSKKFKVSLVLLSQLKKNSSRIATINILKDIGVNIYNPNYIEDTKDVKFPQFFSYNRASIRFHPYSYKKGFKKLEPTQSFNVIPVLKKYAEIHKLKFIIDAFVVSKERQKGPSARVLKFLKEKANEISIEDEVVTTKRLGFNIPKDKIKIPQKDKYERISSNDGITTTNNNHEIMVSKMFNECLGYNNLIHLSSDKNENNLAIDLLYIVNENGKKVAHIHEIKSFLNSSYNKAVGQLLMYKARVQRLMDVDEVICKIVATNEYNNLNVDFKQSLNNNNIKYITYK